MAKGNGHTSFEELLLKRFDEMRDEVRGLRDDFSEFKAEVRNEFGAVRSEIKELREDLKLEIAELRAEVEVLNARVERVERRVDHLIDFTGARWRDVDRRLKRLEAAA